MLLKEISEALLDVSSMEVSIDIASNTSHLVYIVDSSGYLVATSTGNDDYFNFDRYVELCAVCSS